MSTGDGSPGEVTCPPCSICHCPLLRVDVGFHETGIARLSGLPWPHCMHCRRSFWMLWSRHGVQPEYADVRDASIEFRTCDQLSLMGR